MLSHRHGGCIADILSGPSLFVTTTQVSSTTKINKYHKQTEEDKIEDRTPQKMFSSPLYRYFKRLASRLILMYE